MYELAVLDLATNEIPMIDSNYAYMIPEWKEEGIVFIRQIGSIRSEMDRKKSIYLYQDGRFRNLESDYAIFPIGSDGAIWLK